MGKTFNCEIVRSPMVRSLTRGLTDCNWSGDDGGSGPVLWTPINMANLLGWYDGCDASTITESANAVSEWRDKSGNGEHLLQPTGASQPTYDPVAKTVTFDGVDDFLSRSTRYGLALNPALTVASSALKVSFNDDLDFSWMIGADSSGVTGALGGGTGTAGWSWRHNNGFNIYEPVTLGTQEIAVWHRSAGDSYSDQRFRRDGAQKASASSGGASLLSTIANMTLGAGNAALGALNVSNIAYQEFIVAGTDDLTEIEKLEGYLAWKFGREASLPASHPYKSGAPTV